MLNKVQFIEWTVEGNRNVVAILKSGEVIRGKAMVFEDGLLQIKLYEHDVMREIKVDEITDYFNIEKPLNPW